MRPTRTARGTEPQHAYPTCDRGRTDGRDTPSPGQPHVRGYAGTSDSRFRDEVKPKRPSSRASSSLRRAPTLLDRRHRRSLPTPHRGPARPTCGPGDLRHLRLQPRPRPEPNDARRAPAPSRCCPTANPWPAATPPFTPANHQPFAGHLTQLENALAPRSGAAEDVPGLVLEVTSAGPGLAQPPARDHQVGHEYVDCYGEVQAREALHDFHERVRRRGHTSDPARTHHLGAVMSAGGISEENHPAVDVATATWAPVGTAGQREPGNPAQDAPAIHSPGPFYSRVKVLSQM